MELRKPKIFEAQRHYPRIQVTMIEIKQHWFIQLLILKTVFLRISGIMHCALTFVWAAIFMGWLVVEFVFYSVVILGILLVNVLLCCCPQCKYTKLNIFIAIWCKCPVWTRTKTTIQARNAWPWHSSLKFRNQARMATARNKQQHFGVEKKPQTTDHVLNIGLLVYLLCQYRSSGLLLLLPPQGFGPRGPKPEEAS